MSKMKQAIFYISLLVACSESWHGIDATSVQVVGYQTQNKRDEYRYESNIEDRVSRLEEELKDLQASFHLLPFGANGHPEKTYKRERRQTEDFIAFTAYLDHVISHLGINQVIVYDKVLLNAGAAYNTITGHFTCPIAGYYAFSYYVYTAQVHQIVARLVVDGVNEVDGISDTIQQHHEAQGGNFVVLYLKVGQVVAIQNYRWTDTAIDSSPVDRMSTFSGFLIRPFPNDEIVG